MLLEHLEQLAHQIAGGIFLDKNAIDGFTRLYRLNDGANAKYLILLFHYSLSALSICQSLSFNSVRPCWATDEMKRYGTPSNSVSSCWRSSAMSSSSSISAFETTRRRSLSSISGLYFSSSRSKMRYSSAMSPESAGTRNSKVELRSMWRKK